MSEIKASLPHHCSSLIGDVFFMLNLPGARSSFSVGEGVDNIAKTSAFRPAITKTTLVSANPPESVTTGQPITSGTLDDLTLA
jgi:hypothetical protein